MGHREIARKKAETEVLRRLGKRKGTVSARELALETGWPWQVVARALVRLAAKNAVAKQEFVRKDHRSRTRKVVRYKPAEEAPKALPEWLQPKIVQPVAVRMVHGTAGITEEEDSK